VLLLPGPLGDDGIGEAMRHEVAQLEANGYVREGVLAPWVARSLTLLLAPDLHAEAIVTTPTGTSVTQVWARVDAAIIGQIDQRGWVHVAPLDPQSLAWTMRTVVGLTDRIDSAVATRETIDPDRLARFEEALAAGDHRYAHDMVTAGEHHGGEELAIMAALASPERRTWRVTARWTSPTGVELRWLSALDAGCAGLWCSGASVKSTAGEAAPLIATSTAELWNHLIATLPPGTSDVPCASPVNGSAPFGRATCPPSSPPNPTRSSDSSQPPMTSMPA
jgi:hypothetical protein